MSGMKTSDYPNMLTVLAVQILVYDRVGICFSSLCFHLDFSPADQLFKVLEGLLKDSKKDMY